MLATAWTRPLFNPTDHTYGSTITVDGNILIRLITATAEDHVWLTHLGQRITVDGIVWEQPNTIGTARRAFLVNETPPPAPQRYCNLAPSRITAISKRGPEILAIDLERHGQVWCASKAKQREVLQDAGIGVMVALYNVTTTTGHLYLTEKSGIRVIPPQPICRRRKTPSPPPHRPQKRLLTGGRPIKWMCHECGWLTWPGKRNCGACDRERRLGCDYPNWTLFYARRRIGRQSE